MLAQSFAALKNGIELNGLEIYVFSMRQGRFREEFNIDLHAKRDDHDMNFLYLKVFYGRPPDYRPWVELFGMNNEFTIGDSTIRYFGSPYEDMMLGFFATHLEAGEKILVEYADDLDTMRQLSTGMPVVLSRLGFLLFKHGFTWFKDWYFPEGYMEGSQKLQGEKPLDLKNRERHIRIIGEDLARFSHRITRNKIVDPDLESVMMRYDMVKDMLQGGQP